MFLLLARARKEKFFMSIFNGSNKLFTTLELLCRKEKTRSATYFLFAFTTQRFVIHKTLRDTFTYFLLRSSRVEWNVMHNMNFISNRKTTENHFWCLEWIHLKLHEEILLETSSQCLKMTQIVADEFLNFDIFKQFLLN